PPQRTATDFDPGLAPAHNRAHLLERIGKAHIPLNAAGTTAIHTYRAAGDCGSRQEVGGGGCITFHHDLAGGAVVLAGANNEALVVVVDDFHAELRHHIQGDEDVGFGHQIAVHHDLEIAVAERCRHQHGGEELAGDVALDADPAAAQSVRTDTQG